MGNKFKVQRAKVKGQRSKFKGQRAKGKEQKSKVERQKSKGKRRSIGLIAQSSGQIKTKGKYQNHEVLIKKIFN